MSEGVSSIPDTCYPSPDTRSVMSKHIVATVGEIPIGERKIVDVANRSVGIFNIGGEFFALRNRCPHQGGPVCTGRLAGFLAPARVGEYVYSRPGEVLRCPWHGWEYDVRNGQSWYDPINPRIRRYEVAVESGAELGDDPDAPVPGLQKGPYVAETYPVSVDERYVVVEIPE
jgi:3-phenylpropionate/trans-cinnamate dioxygenase ferredoxin subunit